MVDHLVDHRPSLVGQCLVQSAHSGGVCGSDPVAWIARLDPLLPRLDEPDSSLDRGIACMSTTTNVERQGASATSERFYYEYSYQELDEIARLTAALTQRDGRRSAG
jgi:hypothetical protein